MKVVLSLIMLASLVSCSITGAVEEKVYSNTQMGFSLTYPGNWQVVEEPNRVEFFYNGNNLDSLERPTVVITTISENLNVIQTRYRTRNTIEAEEIMIDSLYAFMAVEMDSSMVDAGHPIYTVKNVWVMIDDENLMRFVYSASVNYFSTYRGYAERIIYSTKFN